jgi:hypothetical protein
MEHIKLFKYEIQRTHSLPFGKLACISKRIKRSFISMCPKKNVYTNKIGMCIYLCVLLCFQRIPTQNVIDSKLLTQI